MNDDATLKNKYAAIRATYATERDWIVWLLAAHEPDQLKALMPYLPSKPVTLGPVTDKDRRMILEVRQKCKSEREWLYYLLSEFEPIEVDHILKGLAKGSSANDNVAADEQ